MNLHHPLATTGEERGSREYRGDGSQPAEYPDDFNI